MIPIQNVYYMLSYAFSVLNEQGYRSIATEQFNNVAELCAAILSKGISLQLKRGFGREYIEQTEALSLLRGRIEIAESIKTRSILKRQLVCSYDNFSVNSYMNRIIKTTMVLLMHSDISKTRKKELRKLLVFFGEVETLDVHTINWSMKYNRNNQTYRTLISVCHLVIKGLLQSNRDGKTRVMDFLDKKYMHRLYQDFIFGYYKKECPQLSVTASQIPWVLDDDIDTLLPVMQSDIVLTKGSDVLIIDAKFYNRTTQSRFNKPRIYSSHLYQIFCYVKNKDADFGDKPHTVSGMLLYAATDEAIQPDNTYQMSGNKISARTLDMNKDFAEIAAQLNAIVEEHFKN